MADWLPGLFLVWLKCSMINSMMVYNSEYAKNHWVEHFKWQNYMLCKLNINKRYKNVFYPVNMCIFFSQILGNSDTKGTCIYNCYTLREIWLFYHYNVLPCVLQQFLASSIFGLMQTWPSLFFGYLLKEYLCFFFPFRLTCVCGCEVSCCVHVYLDLFLLFQSIHLSWWMD